MAFTRLPFSPDTVAPSTHPFAMLQDYMTAADIGIREFSRSSGISRSHLIKLMNGEIEPLPEEFEKASAAMVKINNKAYKRK